MTTFWDVFSRLKRKIIGTMEVGREGKGDMSQNWEQEEVAISQYPRPSLEPREDSDLPLEKDIRYMGYSARWD